MRLAPNGSLSLLAPVLRDAHLQGHAGAGLVVAAAQRGALSLVGPASAAMRLSPWQQRGATCQHSGQGATHVLALGTRHHRRCTHRGGGTDTVRRAVRRRESPKPCTPAAPSVKTAMLRRSSAVSGVGMNAPRVDMMSP